MTVETQSYGVDTWKPPKPPYIFIIVLIVVTLGCAVLILKGAA